MDFRVSAHAAHAEPAVPVTTPRLSANRGRGLGISRSRSLSRSRSTSRSCVVPGRYSRDSWSAVGRASHRDSVGTDDTPLPDTATGSSPQPQPQRLKEVKALLSKYKSAFDQGRAAVVTRALALAEECRSDLARPLSGVTSAADDSIAAVIALTALPNRDVVTACLGLLAPVQQELHDTQVRWGRTCVACPNSPPRSRLWST